MKKYIFLALSIFALTLYNCNKDGDGNPSGNDDNSGDYGFPDSLIGIYDLVDIAGGDTTVSTEEYLEFQENDYLIYGLYSQGDSLSQWFAEDGIIGYKDGETGDIVEIHDYEFEGDILYLEDDCNGVIDNKATAPTYKRNE